MTEYAQRIESVQQALRHRDAAFAVIAASDQMRYLTGWQEGGHERLLALFVPASGLPAFIVPAINAQHAQMNPAEIKQIMGWDDATGWQPVVAKLLSGWKANGSSALIDGELLSSHLLEIQRLCPEMKYEAADGILTPLRIRKSPVELDSLERAASTIDQLFVEMLADVREGISEREFADRLVERMKEKQTAPAFGPLICFGENGAMPHHHTGAATLKRGDLAVIDIGCEFEHYKSDITRTISLGAPVDSEAAGLYKVVYAAHQAARKAVRPGATCEEVDLAARAVIEQAGYGEQFIHRTGHGIGLSGHEPPYIVQGNKLALAPGMCFSIEPGVYLPGRFGVRIENIVTVTEAGCRSLNAEPSPTLRVI